ncbi:WG repeat-containing protein [Myroides odoratus]|uniref:WG repeat-containing protein n=1 Tax=Myroides odoratus TaxID=256 RepID=UPI0039B04623
MKSNHLIFSVIALGLGGCASFQSSYQPFMYDNGPDYVVEGVYRIVDEEGKMGFANVRGEVVIQPQFAFVFPFENGLAKATQEGKKQEVEGSKGEYHYWNSENWFYIDKKGNTVSNQPNN